MGKRPYKEEEVELEDGDDEEDDGEVGGGAGSEVDFEMLKAAILVHLVSVGEPTSAGKLGHGLNAKKKPISAALFSLLEAGHVEKADTNFAPKWSVPEEIAGTVVGTQGTVVPARYSYDASKKGAGQRSSKSDFDTVKNIVQSHLKPKGSGGVSAGALGWSVSASKKPINAALYALEKEGLAWTVTDKESGTKLRWEGVPKKCNDKLPACFAHAGTAASAATVGQPAQKKAKVSRPTGGSGDGFEDMKLFLRGKLFAYGEQGVTSGKLGWEFSGNRKAITAALHSCLAEGTVKNLTDEGHPRWVSVVKPPHAAMSMEMPDCFSYQGKGGGKGGGKTTPAVAVTSAASKKKKPAAGGAIKHAVAASGSMPDSSENPVAFLNQWCQKEKKSLSFRDLGQDASGDFQFQAVVENQELTIMVGPNKKAAKSAAAGGAIQELDI